MPAHLKPADRRQRRNKKTNVVPFRSVAKAKKIPAPPEKLLKVNRESWKRYWNSQLAQVVEPDTDLPAITRLWTIYDLRERAHRAYRRQPMIEGSEGQPVENPAGRAMRSYDAEIRQMEDGLGMTPRARLQLGITFGSAVKPMEELNWRLADDYDPEEEEDPRGI